MKKDILGIKIDDINIDQVTETVKGWLSSPVKHYIVTPNPEIVVMAQKDESLRKIINNADLAVPDGNGLKIATDIVCNIPGIDLMEALIKTAEENGFTVSLLGGKYGVAVKAAECLRLRYPKLKVSFAKSGGDISKEGDGGDLGNLGDLGKADILFVGFGPPKQEKWIARNLNKLDVKVAMGVGGAFDIFSGRIPRAPLWLRNLRLEWFFRLIIQPWRIKRQLKLFQYIYLLLLDQLRRK